MTNDRSREVIVYGALGLVVGIAIFQGLTIGRLMQQNVALRTDDRFARPLTLLRSPSTEQTSATLPEPREERPEEPAEVKSTEIEERLLATEDALATLSRPLYANVLSSTINAAVAHGETLVTGGYLAQDGHYHFTFITPESVALDDGRSAVTLNTRVMALSEAGVTVTGMETLATQVRNTLQHGEAWSAEEVTAAINVLAGTAEQSLLAMPSVVTLPGHEARIQIDGSGFELNARPDLLDDGSGYLLQVRLEQPNEPVPDVLPVDDGTWVE